MPSFFISAFEVVWFFLPAFIGNMAPVLAAHYHWFPRLNIPLDKGLYLGNSRLLGQNKTVRGLVLGVCAGALAGLFQYLCVLFTTNASSFFQAYQNPIHAVSLGALIGFGALLGDALKSFYKRRLRIPAGSSWKPWDQIDIVVGVLLVTAPFAPLTFFEFILSFIITGIGMLMVSYIGYVSGIKQSI